MENPQKALVQSPNITNLPDALLSKIIKNLNAYEILVYQRVSKAFKHAVDESLREVSARFIPPVATQSLSKHLLKDALIDFLKTKPASLHDFQFWIEYIPPEKPSKVVPVKYCGDTCASTLVFKVPPPEEGTEFEMLEEYEIRLCVKFTQRFKTRFRVFDLDIESDVHGVAKLFGATVAWLQPANLLFDDSEEDLEKWGDNYLLKFMRMLSPIQVDLIPDDEIILALVRIFSAERNHGLLRNFFH